MEEHWNVGWNPPEYPKDQGVGMYPATPWRYQDGEVLPELVKPSQVCGPSFCEGGERHYIVAQNF